MKKINILNRILNESKDNEKIVRCIGTLFISILLMSIIFTSYVSAGPGVTVNEISGKIPTVTIGAPGTSLQIQVHGPYNTGEPPHTKVTGSINGKSIPSTHINPDGSSTPKKIDTTGGKGTGKVGVTTTVDANGKVTIRVEDPTGKSGVVEADPKDGKISGVGSDPNNKVSIDAKNPRRVVIIIPMAKKRVKENPQVLNLQNLVLGTLGGGLERKLVERRLEE